METRKKKSEILRILGHVSLFSGLTSPQLEQIYTRSAERLYKKDQFIFKEGDKGDSMMIILEGEARVTQMIDSDQEEALVVLKEGEGFGEMALLEKRPRSATVLAQKDILLMEITRDQFMDFIDKNPRGGNRILLNIARILSGRLRETDTKLKTFINLSKWI